MSQPTPAPYTALAEVSKSMTQQWLFNLQQLAFHLTFYPHMVEPSALQTLRQSALLIVGAIPEEKQQQEGGGVTQ